MELFSWGCPVSCKHLMCCFVKQVSNNSMCDRHVVPIETYATLEHGAMVKMHDLCAPPQVPRQHL